MSHCYLSSPKSAGFQVINIAIFSRTYKETGKSAARGSAGLVQPLTIYQCSGALVARAGVDAGPPVFRAVDCIKDTQVSWVKNIQNLMLSFILGSGFCLFVSEWERSILRHIETFLLLGASGTWGHGPWRISPYWDNWGKHWFLSLPLLHACSSLCPPREAPLAFCQAQMSASVLLSLPVDMVMYDRHQFLTLAGQQVTSISKRGSKLKTGMFQQGNSIWFQRWKIKFIN